MNVTPKLYISCGHRRTEFQGKEHSDPYTFKPHTTSERLSQEHLCENPVKLGVRLCDKVQKNSGFLHEEDKCDTQGSNKDEKSVDMH